MCKKIFTALAVLIALSFVPLPSIIPHHGTSDEIMQRPAGFPADFGLSEITAQNAPVSGARFPSDSGPVATFYAALTDTTVTTAFAARGAGISNYIYSAQCINTSAATVDAMIIKSATTAIATIGCPAAGAFSPMVHFIPPLRGAANALISVESAASTTTAYMYIVSRAARYGL